MPARNDWAVSSRFASMSGVRMKPGPTALTRTPLGGVLERGVLGQADERVLGGDVGGGVREADRAEDGGDVDDRAAAVRAAMASSWARMP